MCVLIPVMARWFFLLAFFFFILLHSSSSSCASFSSPWFYSIGDVFHAVPDQLPAMGKNHVDELDKAREAFYEKFIVVPSGGQKHMYKCNAVAKEI